MNSILLSNISLDSTLDPKDEPIDTIIDIQENEIIFPVKEEPVYASEAEENLKLHIHETPFTKLINTNPDLLNEDIEFPTNSLLDDKSIIHSANSAKPNEIPQTKLEPSEIVDIEEKEYVLHNTKAGGVRRHLLVACPICKRKYVKRNLRKHMKTHVENKEDKPHYKRTQCEECQKVVAAISLPRHMKIHTSKKFVCTYCGKQFRRAQQLDSHEMMHTGEKPYACEVCGKSFNRKTYLKIHMKIHISEKPFVCTYCGKQFGQAYYLKSHVIVHTGEKPYACEVCGKRFKWKTYLKIHTNAVHGGERPFVCIVCKKSFPFPTSLGLHMKIHNRDKKFKCTICNYSCIQNNDLKTHMVKHTKERKFECAACGLKYGRADSLNRHVLRLCKGKPKKSTKSKNDENPKTTGTEEKKN